MRASLGPTAQQSVLQELRRAIRLGLLPPGTQLVQDALAEQLGFSVVPIREALPILVSEGQLTYVPRRGYFVNSLSERELAEVRSIRATLERLAAHEAAGKLTDDANASMRAAISSIEDEATAEPALLHEHSYRFFFALFDCAAMPRLTGMLETVWNQPHPHTSPPVVSDRQRATCARLLRRVLRLARAGKSDELYDAIQRYHLETQAI